jgi:hypothetical protein
MIDGTVQGAIEFRFEMLLAMLSIIADSDTSVIIPTSNQYSDPNQT